MKISVNLDPMINFLVVAVDPVATAVGKTAMVIGFAIYDAGYWQAFVGGGNEPS